jgi:hypothetical protein
MPMSTYLLTCDCGKTVPVEVGQAGERVACECGAQLEVPTLRKLRHLPVARSELAPSRGAWSASKGLVAAGLIVAGLLAIAAAWSWLTEPAVPKFDPDAQLRAVDMELAEITPSNAWLRWVTYYQPLARLGFSDLQYPYTAVIERQIAQRRFLQTMLLVIAGVCAAVALIALFWPGKQDVRKTKSR